MPEKHKQNQGVPGKGSRGKRATNPTKVAGATLRMVFGFYPLQFSLMILCVVAAAVLSTFPSVVLQRTIDVIGRTWQTGDWSAAAPEVTSIALSLIAIYAIALACQIAQTQLGAFLTQATLKEIRNKMFDHMEDLPVRFFDQNQRGDVMSYYTNDVDASLAEYEQMMKNAGIEKMVEEIQKQMDAYCDTHPLK